jgi:hypothetical protein
VCDSKKRRKLPRKDPQMKGTVKLTAWQQINLLAVFLMQTKHCEMDHKGQRGFTKRRLIEGFLSLLFSKSKVSTYLSMVCLATLWLKTHFGFFAI